MIEKYVYNCLLIILELITEIVWVNSNVAEHIIADTAWLVWYQPAVARLLQLATSATSASELTAIDTYVQQLVNQCGLFRLPIRA